MPVNWVDVADWASDNEDWLKKYLVLQNGTPSHDTFGRVGGEPLRDPGKRPWAHRDAVPCVGVDTLQSMEPSLRHNWKNLAGVGMVERQWESKGKVPVERTFYIGAKGIGSAQALAEAGGELKTACTGCSMSRSSRTAVGCAQGMRRATSRLYESSL